MSVTDTTSELLKQGDRLTLDEFLRRWEAMPHLKMAELIEGTVYMPSPLSLEHGGMDRYVSGWLLHYQVHTPGTGGGDNATTILDDDSPQPDHSLFLRPEAGGRTSVKRKRKYNLLHGAPEFVAEVCASSESYDLGVKKDLYERQRVDEYLAVLIDEQEIRWHRWEDGGYQIVPADADGVRRSAIFPGLWLDGEALLGGNIAKVLAVLQRGLESPEHAEFLERLKKRIASS